MERKRNLLSVRDIAAMRYYYSKGHRISELARQFRVHESVASNICHGRTHKRVLPADNLPPLPVQRTPEEQAERSKRVAQAASRPRFPRR